VRLLLREGYGKGVEGGMREGKERRGEKERGG